jgi:hypothetical protein
MRRQPANALSNLGFVVAGVAVGWRAELPSGRLAPPGLATTYALVVVLLGPGSMAMHATQTELGGRFDQLSMYLIACFALAYALMRATARSTGFLVALFVALFVALLLVSEAVEQVHVLLPVVDNTGNLVFGIQLAATIFVETRLRRRGDRSLDVRWVLGAVGAWCLYRYWSSAVTVEPAPVLARSYVWRRVTGCRSGGEPTSGSAAARSTSSSEVPCRSASKAARPPRAPKSRLVHTR